MSDLDSSSAHRDKGLMSPRERYHRFRHIAAELRLDDEPPAPSRDRIEGMQDLCYRLYSAEVADLIAARLGVTRQAVREALDAGLRWSPYAAPSGGTPSAEAAGLQGAP